MVLLALMAMPFLARTRACALGHGAYREQDRQRSQGSEPQGGERSYRMCAREHDGRHEDSRPHGPERVALRRRRHAAVRDESFEAWAEPRVCAEPLREPRRALREAGTEAARTNTVVGSPGTTIPAAASTTAHQPRPPKTTLVELTRREVFVTGTSPTPWPGRRPPVLHVATTPGRASAPAGGIPRTPDARA